jgi:hypothetical protein
MKRLILFAILFLVSYAAKAQDIIVMRNADEVMAKVTSITQDQVTYKRWSNLDGPSYTISKSQIFYIKYENGEKDLMNAVPETRARVREHCNNTSSSLPVAFRGYASVGTIFLSEMAGPTLDVSAGVFLFDHLYAGIEVGFHSLLEKYDYYEGDYYYGDDDWGEYSEILFGGYIPLGVNLKGYLTKKFAVNPYLECSLGAFVGIGDFSGETGFHCRVGAGIEYKRFNVGIGYNALVEYGFPLNMGYVNLGFRFGK